MSTAVDVRMAEKMCGAIRGAREEGKATLQIRKLFVPSGVGFRKTAGARCRRRPTSLQALYYQTNNVEDDVVLFVAVETQRTQ